MRIAVDIDEVLADLLTEYINFVNHNHGLGLTRNRFTGYYTWDTWDWTLKQKISLFDAFYKSDNFMRVKRIAGALGALRRMKRSNELFIVTSRPDYLEKSTTEWVQTNFPNIFDSLHFASHLENKKKSDICESLDIEVIIEDSYEYASECAARGVRAILIDFPWNIDKPAHNNISRVASWKAIPTTINITNS